MSANERKLTAREYYKRRAKLDTLTDRAHQVVDDLEGYLIELGPEDLVGQPEGELLQAVADLMAELQMYRIGQGFE